MANYTARWLTAKYPTVCHGYQCKRPINPGDRMLYMGKAKFAWCEDCGKIAEQDYRPIPWGK